MIERLKAERENSENEWFQAGREEGIEAAEDTSYDEFIMISEAFGCGRGDLWSEELWEEDAFDWISESVERQSVPETHRSDFYRGVFDGLLDQWLAVKDEVC